MRIPFATRSYKSRSLPVSSQRLVNWFPEIQPQDAASPIAVFPTPGLVSWSTVGNGPIRGMGTLGGVLYCVSGSSLYSVDSNGTETLIGTITGTGRVQMVENGAELFIATGSTGYTYDTTAGLVAISAAGYPSGDHALFIDGYFVTNQPSTGRFFFSTVYDGTAWDALDFYTAESAPDNLVSMLVDHRELWLFGEKSTEIWVAVASGFARQTVIETGCAAKWSTAKTHNSVFWLGEDRVVYRADGYTPMPISDPGVNAAIAGYSVVSDAYGWTHTFEGHMFYTLTFPTEGETWVYDLTTQAWHERESEGETQYRANNYIRHYGLQLVGDYSAGVIYKMDRDVHTDAGEWIRRIAISPPVVREFWSALQVEFEHGVGLTSGQGSDPTVSLEWSDDAKTWSNSHDRQSGKIGEYRSRCVWRRLGQPRRRILGKPAQRIFKITVTDPIKWVLIDAHAE